MRPYPRAISAKDFSDQGEDVTTEAESVKISVLYHSVRLVRLTWADVYKAVTGQPSTDYPGADDKPLYVRWLQLRLNEMGYLAGALTGAKDDQTKRAIRRYSYASPGQVETDDESKGGLAAYIGSGVRARGDLVETPAALTDPQKSSRILLDHDYFVVEQNAVEDAPSGTGEANKADGHAAMESARLDRFEVPLLVEALLVSKNDRTGGGKGVTAPEAIGPVRCEWHVYDPPEDLSVITAPFTTVAEDARTRAKPYLLAAQKKLAKGDVEDPLKAYDNCPVSLGGIRPADKDDMTPYFRAKGLDGVFQDEISGSKYLTKFLLRSANASQDWLKGTTGALFRGSYIAGDNWVVQARLSLEGLVGKEDIVALHKKLPRLANCFGDYAPGDPLAPMTGKLTVWRRQHVSAVIDWWSNDKPGAIDWDVIVAAFKAAHVVLVPPGAPVAVETLADDGARRGYVAEVARVAKAIKPKSSFLGKPSREPALQWRGDAIIPIRFPTRNQRVDEDVMAFAVDEAGSTIISHFAGPTNGMYRVPADFLRSLVGTRAGQIVVRFDHLTPAVLRDHLNGVDQAAFDRGELVLKELPHYKQDKDRGDGGLSIGVSGGVAMIEDRHSRQFAGSFLVAHEMGHNFYLTHAHDFAADHDTADKNCTMHYPSTTSKALRDLGWGIRQGGGAPIPLFCGKCLLKLRGWKVRDPALPEGST